MTLPRSGWNLICTNEPQHPQMDSNNRDMIVEFFQDMGRIRSKLTSMAGHVSECDSVAENLKFDTVTLLNDFLAHTSTSMANLNHLASQGVEINAALRSTNRSRRLLEKYRQDTSAPAQKSLHRRLDDATADD